MIKSLPLEENPREKAKNFGIGSLSNVELLALLLRTGSKTESVMDLAARLLREVGGLENLRYVSYHTLTALKGIKAAKAIEVLAAVELAKRMKVKRPNANIIRSPQAVYDFLNDMQGYTQEHFVILILDNGHRIIARKTLFIGTVNASIIDVREIFVQVLKVNGVALIAVHNHPSGQAIPSKADLDVTRAIQQAGKMMNVQLLDHIIIGHDQYYSILGQQFYDGHGEDVIE